MYTDAEWEAALRAAQEEGTRRRSRQIAVVRERDPKYRFVHSHRPAAEAAAYPVRGRKSERTVMETFIRDSSATASAYLCWHADRPVGKTALLADFVQRPPRGTDVLSFFISAAHGTDTRAEFEEQMADQLGALLRSSRCRAPSGVRQWKRRFTAAAEQSLRYGRTLLLVVDGLDDDVAWTGVASSSGTQAAVEGGSIAALLPASPPPGMRVIVSLRRGGRFPDDLPARHPLRLQKYRRSLAPVGGGAQVRRTPPDDSTLGRSVGELLATAGGGLRTTDLAELAGFPADLIDRMVQGPAGRSVVLDDPVFQTYALAGPDLVQTVRESLGEQGVTRHTRMLLAWSHGWRAAGWPIDTPPYALTHQLRLLNGAETRAAYILDIPRLRRLASSAGPDTALSQLEAFEDEIGPTDATPGSLAVLVPLAAVRTLLQAESREVPPGAPALLIRLGDVQRALGLARSAPTATARAVHLADAVVEMAYADQEGADAVAREAAGWLSRNDQGYPGKYQDPETYTRLLGAARTLLSLNRRVAARALLRAVVRDTAAETEALTEAARLLIATGDEGVVMALCERAETLGAGSTRGRAAAVDLWGALARAMPALSSDAGDRVIAICGDLDASDGLGAVDVMASAGSALGRLPRRRHAAARAAAQKALAQFIGALAEPDVLSDDDQAYLCRELSGTLVRLAQAMDDAGRTRNALDDIGRLLQSLPEQLRVGVLGDAIAERARSVVEAGEERRTQEDREASITAKKQRNMERRKKDEERKELNVWRNKDGGTRSEPRNKQRTVLPAPAISPTRRHRPSTGLRSSGDGQCRDHLVSLQEADGQLGAGNLLGSRELLETALRHSPVSSSRPPVPENWTTSLCQALGTAGEFDAAEALAECLSGTPDRVLHLSALSLGCSLGGHREEGDRYAHEAARLVSDDPGPGVANVVAQALAYAGDGPMAIVMPTGRNSTEKRQARAAVAAGLMSHCPEEAVRIAKSHTEALRRRIDVGSPLRVLPELAALLLAYPDIRQPDPRLHEAIRLAALRVTDTPPPWHASTMTVLSLLERFGCLPEGNSDLVAGLTSRWQHSLQPGEEPRTELALLSAVEGDTTALWRHADAARTREERVAALCAAATYLAGAPVALTTDSRADDRVIRTCLALARRCDDSSPSAQATARRIVRSLLRTESWAHTIPLLPQLAPGALGRLSVIAGDVGWRTD
ncbi:hypothetical protein [Streptomyces sp. NPDC045369]|uniref:hypothetical protein n=1 Tax=Streptomyces sp. NPDC045369 TaxID=3155732 RepID=UPI0033C4129F